MCNNNKKEINIYESVTPVDVYQAMDDNKKLRELVHRHLVLYADGYFVIPDDKYVSLDSNGYHLTRYAKDNLTECVIKIEIEKIWERFPIQNSFYYGLPNNNYIKKFKVVFEDKHKKDKEKKTSVELAQNAISELLNEDKITPRKDIDTEIEFLTSRYYDIEGEKTLLEKINDKANNTLCQCLSYLFERRHWYENDFYRFTLLHRNYYNKILNNTKSQNNMSAKALFAICVGLKLNRRLTEKLFTRSIHNLDSLGSPYCYYLEILENTPYLPIEEFNDILKSWGLSPLGSKERNHKNHKN